MMQREPLYRGISIETGEWVYGGISKNQSSDFFIIQDDTFYFIDNYGVSTADIRISKVKPESVGQFTGLRDSKKTEEFPEGEKIFEGDVVKVQDSVCKVEFMDSCFEIKDIKTGWRDYLKCWTCNHAVTVIGNIYQNKELLGGE